MIVNVAYRFDARKQRKRKKGNFCRVARGRCSKRDTKRILQYWLKGISTCTKGREIFSRRVGSEG